MELSRQIFSHYELRIINILSKVDLKKFVAKTWLNVETTGLPEGVVLHSVGLLEWRLMRVDEMDEDGDGEDRGDGGRRRMKWFCVGSKGLRGFMGWE